MIRDQYTLDLNGELIVDNFAGGGGASTGIELALGRHVDIAINHDPEAVAMHSINHPQTDHHCESVWDVDPGKVTNGRPVGFAWFSPDCKHFSKAKGGKPREKKIRGLAWVVLRWVAHPTAKPRVFTLENVEEFKTWGPLLADGQPDPSQKGRTFRSFVNALKRHGYHVEWRELRACDYGAPTIRKRLFLIARCDGAPIVWPEPTHGDPESAGVKSGKLKPWLTAAECIDWSIPVKSIFERAKPLAEATLKRIARGIRRYVIESANPYLVTLAHGEGKPGGVQRRGPGVRDIELPVPTITASGGYGVVAPSLVKVNHGGDHFRGQSIEAPVNTLTSKHGLALTAATLIQAGYGERPGQQPRVPGIDKPLGTVVAGGIKHALVGAQLVGAGGPAYSGKPRGVDLPMHTLTTESHTAIAAATLIKHYGGNYDGAGVDLNAPIHTVTTTDHHALLASNLVRQFGNSDAAAVDAPVGTVTAGGGGKTQLVTSHLLKMRHYSDGQSVETPIDTVAAGGLHFGEVRAFLIKYYGNEKEGVDIREPMHTIPCTDRFGLVTVGGQTYQIADIGMRMLEPHELYAAQGFPSTYVIAPYVNGRQLSKAAQVRMCGNSVCPPLASALARANVPEMAVWTSKELKSMKEPA